MRTSRQSSTFLFWLQIVPCGIKLCMCFKSFSMLKGATLNNNYCWSYIILHCHIVNYLYPYCCIPENLNKIIMFSKYVYFSISFVENQKKKTLKLYNRTSLLWSNFNSWGPIFVGNQNFAGLWGCNFVGKWEIMWTAEYL